MRYPPLVWNNPNFIGWTLYDEAGQPIVGATVTATLYVGRSEDDPATTPGTPVASMDDLALMDEGDGSYSTSVPAAAIPTIGDDYVFVFDAMMGSVEIGHWEPTTSVVKEAPRVPNLAELDNVKQYLGIPLDDISQDASLNRWIGAVSADFLNRIKRPGLLPPTDYVESIQLTNWRNEDREKDIFLKNWPVNRIASVTVNGIACPAYDPADPTQTGWFFDSTLPDEERQHITMLGSFWPVMQDWFTPRRPIYRPSPVRITVSYNAGYSYVPYDIEEAITEWVAFKKGLAQLQAHDQTEQWIQLGQYQQNNMIAGSTMKTSSIDMPESVMSVINVYERPIVP